MICKECPPRLRWRRWVTDHVFRDGGLGDGKAKLQKLAMDPRCAPPCVLPRHPSDQIADLPRHRRSARFSPLRLPCPEKPEPVPSIYSIVPPNDGSALRHGHHFEPVDFEIDHGRGHRDAYSAGSCQQTYARACGCRQRPRRHREELIESERGWSGREAFVTMMQTADLGQGNDRSGPARLNGSSTRCGLADRQVGP